MKTYVRGTLFILLTCLVVSGVGCKAGADFARVSGEADLVLLDGRSCVASAFADGRSVYFTMDTGSGVSALLEWWVNDQGLETIEMPPLLVIGAHGGTVEFDRGVRIDELRFGDLRWRLLELYLLSDEHFERTAVEHGEFHEGGVLGWDLMEDFVLVHERSPRRLRLVERDQLQTELQRLGPVELWRRHPLTWESGVPHLHVPIPGSESLECTLDTGADTTILPTSAAQALGGVVVSDDSLSLTTIGGPLVVSRYRIDHWPLFGRRVFGVISAADDVNGVLGYDVLRHLDFLIDPEAGELWTLDPETDERSSR